MYLGEAFLQESIVNSENTKRKDKSKNKAAFLIITGQQKNNEAT